MSSSNQDNKGKDSRDESHRSRSRSATRKRSYNGDNNQNASAQRDNRFQNGSGTPKPNGSGGVHHQQQQHFTDMAKTQHDSNASLSSQAQQESLSYRHARRLYIGNIPETINQEYLSEWLYRSLEAAGGLQAQLSSENPIVKCEIDPKGRFSFIELRSIEETSAMLQLDGIILWHRQLRIRRPTEFEKYPQVSQGSVPKLNFDLFKTVGIVIIPTVVDDGPNKIFLANLPTKMDELMILDELKLRDIGDIKAFHLVKDNQTNQSKGYAFFEFKDSSLTESAIHTLNGMQYAGRTLTCKRSQMSSGNRQQGSNNGGGGQRQMNNRPNEQQFGIQQMMMGVNDGNGYFPNYTQGGAVTSTGGNMPRKNIQQQMQNFPQQQQQQNNGGRRTPAMQGGAAGGAPQGFNQSLQQQISQQQLQQSQQQFKGGNSAKKQWGGAEQQMDGIYDASMMNQFELQQQNYQFQGQQQQQQVPQQQAQQVQQYMMHGAPQGQQYQ